MRLADESKAGWWGAEQASSPAFRRFALIDDDRGNQSGNRRVVAGAKRELAGDLIEAISAEDFPVTGEMLEEVERRLEDYRRDPSKGTSLAEIEARIQRR